MVLSLSRFLTFFKRREGRKLVPRLDLMALSDHDLADLNLPPDVSSTAFLQRQRERSGW
jgi:hypothetical protein